jgi:alginate O-acetyltransferase complex protein AlgI
MIFTTWLYGLFLAIAVAGFWVLPPRARPIWLIVAGLTFYANYFPPHVILIALCTVAVYGAARFAAAAGGRPRSVILGLAVAASLGLLGYYKYTGFALDTLAGVGVPRPGWDLVARPVPLAISFFVFEYVQYLVELRRGTVAPGRPRDFLLFILFFPTLICGPIKRFKDFQPQIGRPARLRPEELSRGLERIVVGLAKKLVVADPVGRAIAPLWQAPLDLPTWTLWLAVYGYAIQILFDFSGYSDIAIGSARLLGFDVPENFDYPYLQANVRRFWGSWHMSLTSWIADYVYIPLGGNRRGAVRTHVNRLVAMGLCGLWHGAAGHFVLWGLYHGLGLNVYHAYRAIRARLPVRADFGILGHLTAVVVTFHFVCVGWVLFVVDAATAPSVIAALFGLR